MTKDELIAATEREWEALQAALDGLDDEHLTEIPVAGEWTVKDILAHLAVWMSRLITNLYKIERGVEPEFDLTDAQVDALNAQFYRDQKNRPLDRVLDDLHSVHLALLNRLEGMSDAMLSDPKKYKLLKGKSLSELVAIDSVEHFREHATDIRAWRRSTDRFAKRTNGQ